MKKRYVLSYEGEQHTAVVAKDADKIAVQVDDGERSEIDCAPVLGGRALSVRIGGKIRLVHLTGLDNAGKVAATIGGRPIPLTVMDELHAMALESLGTAASSGTIAADIPGLVIEVRVKEGQKVHQGQPVIVVEAMKMQNELAAPVAGTVMEIPVGAGDTVNPGDTLVVIEPEPGG